MILRFVMVTDELIVIDVSMFYVSFRTNSGIFLNFKVCRFVMMTLFGVSMNYKKRLSGEFAVLNITGFYISDRKLSGNKETLGKI